MGVHHRHLERITFSQLDMKLTVQLSVPHHFHVQADICPLTAWENIHWQHTETN